ncbi:hypothetical protein BJ878DRAFT_563348 [Calycina marina]|uniref:Uncharacterized protein n=1 Tax=Calycina marina TaxID=1763456 RepID=A0A9P7ZC78_9HELO|nr:hypothetical protein BJ878DRAFT_563348 [Calycina marina]
MLFRQTCCTENAERHEYTLFDAVSSQARQRGPKSPRTSSLVSAIRSTASPIFVMAQFALPQYISGRGRKEWDLIEFLMAQAIAYAASNPTASVRSLWSYLVLGTTEAWQQLQLSLDGDAYSDLEDKAIVYLIVEYLLQNEVRRPEAVGNHGEDVYVIKKYSHEQIRQRQEIDKLDYCHKHRLDIFNNNIHERISWHKCDGHLVNLDIAPAANQEILDDALWVYVRGKELTEYKTSEQLRQLLLIRVNKINEQDHLFLDRGNQKVRRYQQEAQIDRKGYETDVLRTILNHSTVYALKSTLLIVGKFRPDTNLQLYFHPDESDILYDNHTLSRYVDRDWTKLRLKVFVQWAFGPSSDSKGTLDRQSVKEVPR